MEAWKARKGWEGGIKCGVFQHWQSESIEEKQGVIFLSRKRHLLLERTCPWFTLWLKQTFQDFLQDKKNIESFQNRRQVHLWRGVGDSPHKRDPWYRCPHHTHRRLQRWLSVWDTVDGVCSGSHHPLHQERGGGGSADLEREVNRKVF